MNPSTATTRLAELADRYWQFLRREQPITALLAGQPIDDPDLMREAPEDHARRDASAAAFLSDLAAIDAGALPPAELATHKLLQHELEGLRRAFALRAYMRPSLFPMGPEFTLAYAGNIVTLSNAADARRWIAQLSTIPGALDGVVRCMREGIAAGIRTSSLEIERAVGNVKGLLAAGPEDSAFHEPFKRAAGRLPAVDALAAEGLAVVTQKIWPALEAYGAFIADELGARQRDSLACTDSPDGAAFYSALIRQFATVDDSPDAIHALGLSEVERLEADTAACAAAAGFPNDIAGFRASLKDPSQFAASGPALREEIEVLSKRIDALLPSFIGCLPRSTYGVRSIPEALSARMPPAYAQPNPADNTGPGVHWITSTPGKCPRYMHVPLALHEAWPGHLMHLALIQEQSQLPAFRRYGALGYSACLEGWALYCEFLGEEMGLYDTPQKRYGRIEMEMWRAVRLVVDTGIHAKGWSRQQSIDFAAAHMAMPLATIEAEVDRYVALPGQALAYQIGNLRFRALRRRAESRLGERFRLRAFHDALMAAGPVTLPVLDDLIELWIASQERAVAA
jgi:uncharacterized protein (DUF885 family)